MNKRLGSRRPWAIATLGLLSTFGALIAQDDGNESVDPSDSGAVLGEEITVVDRAAASETAVLREIGREELELAGARTAADIVQFTAGLHLLSSGARGGTAHAQIRGGDPNFSVVLLDGVPLNDPTGVQGGAFNLSALAMDQIEQIQILRGPHSYFLGSSALGGVVSFRTTRGSGDHKARTSLEAGSHDLARGAVSLGASRKRYDWFVGVGAETETHTIADDSYGQSSLQTSLGGQLTDRVRLRFVGRYADTEIDDYPEASGGPIYGSGELRLTEKEVFSNGVSADIGGAQWHHRASLTHVSLRTLVDSPPILPLVPPSAEDRRYERTQFNWSSAHDASDRLSLAFGGQLDRENGDNESLLLLPDFFGGPIQGDYAIERTTLGAFAEATVRTGRVTFNFGSRADDPEHLDLEWSPRLGLVAHLGDSGWRLRSSWSQAFKLPSFFALASPPQLGGNPGLRPETSEGLDLGLELDRPQSSIAIVAFVNRYNDLIDFDFDTFQNINRSHVEAEGIEISSQLQPTDRLRLGIDWTFQDVVDLATGELLLNEPAWFGSLRIDWRGTPEVDLHLDARFSAGSLDQQLAVPDRDSVDGYEVFGLSLRWQMSRSLVITGRLDNLTDAEWQQFIGFPQPRRSGRVSVAWSWF